MPNRIIKESICTSDSVDSLSAFQETFFYRLTVNCDDFGRMDARPKILKSKLFPLKDIREDQMKAALEALSSAELVILYEVDGKPFLQMKTWEKHQQVRARKSKYPEPPQILSNDSTFSQKDNACNHLISNDIKCARNPIQSESVSESNPNPMRENTHARAKEDDGFEPFWNAYPRRSGDIKEAYLAYRRALQSGATPQQILDAVKWQAEEWEREGQPQYIPSPVKWLDNKRWSEKPRSPGKRVTTFMDV